MASRLLSIDEVCYPTCHKQPDLISYDSSSSGFPSYSIPGENLTMALFFSFKNDVSGLKRFDLMSSLTMLAVSYGIDVSSPPSAPSGTSALEDSFADLQPASPFPILIRATNGKSKDELGKKIKLSTIVHSDGLENFYQHYADVCKSGMHGLRKRDRAGRKKAKAKEKKVNIEADKMA